MPNSRKTENRVDHSSKNRDRSLAESRVLGAT
jgi:hypothetical protein